MRGAPLTGCELAVSSQNGEDGVLQAIFRLVGARSQDFVEFGVGDGGQGNCVLLADDLGWSGLFIEADRDAYRALAAKYADSRRVRTLDALVTADNVEALFRAARVPPEFDVLSIDIDGNDFWVWRALTEFTPRVVVVEYNANLTPDAMLVMPRDDDHQWDGTDYFGASLGAYRALAAEKGYRLVHTDSTGVNAFFALNSLAGPLPPPAAVPVYAADYFKSGLTLPHDPLGRPFLDLASGELVEASRQAARRSE